MAFGVHLSIMIRTPYDMEAVEEKYHAIIDFKVFSSFDTANLIKSDWTPFSSFR